MRIRYLLIAGAAALALGLAGCGSSDDDSTAEAPVTMPEPEPTPDPGPTDLEATQTAAADAAAAAMTASDNAAASASSAADATANIATLQTNGMAADHAYAAHKAAGEAADAASEAAAASADAAAATTGAAAEAAWAMADAAQTAAEAAETTATEMADAALAAAMTELHIDGTVKTVGDSSVDASSEFSSVTTGSNTVITGLIASMNPMGTGGGLMGNPRTDAIVDDLSTQADETAAATPYQQTAAARTFAIGKTLDSSDDMARLMIVTDYAGRNMVRVFAQGTSGSDVDGTKAGYISIDSGTNNVALRSEGTHNVVCDFGRHKGTLYTRMPVSYLKWMVNSGHSRVRFAEAELQRRGTTTPDLDISGHAIDRASLSCRKTWHETRGKDEGLHAWLCRVAREALDAGKVNGKGRHVHLGIQFAFEMDGVWPVLKTVMPAKNPGERK